IRRPAWLSNAIPAGGGTVKTDTVYKQAFNAILPILRQAGTGAVLPSENVLCTQLNVSRTTVRKVLSRLTEQGFVKLGAEGRVVAALPPAGSAYPEPETLSASE